MQNIVPQQPAGAFIFGRGGQRISQDDIAMRRRLAAQQMAGATDTSPVGHWSQGLARALGGVTGALQMRRADKDAAANQEALQAQIVAALSGEGGSPEGGDPIAALLANPETQAIGAQILKGRQAPPQDVPELIQYARIANDPTRPEWERKAAADRVTVLNDPLSVITNSAGTQILPRSQLLGMTAPQAVSPPPEAIAELQADPSAAAEFDEAFGAGAAARVLGGGGAGNGTGGFPGLR
jgi:hypothetical protein